MKIIKFTEIEAELYESYIREWEDTGELIVPFASKRDNRSFQDLQSYWLECQTEAMFERGFVPSTLFFMVDENQILGAIHLRHELSERLLKGGGHIGYGIRPSQRGKGYGKVMLKLFLEEIITDSFEKVLITCNEDNPASASTIESCGGILEDKVIFDGVETRRYWVDI